MAKRIFKVKPSFLVEMINEEKKKMKGFGNQTPVEDADEADEVEADELADTLEKKVEHLKGLKEQERKLSARLREIQAKKRKVLGEI